MTPPLDHGRAASAEELASHEIGAAAAVSGAIARERSPPVSLLLRQAMSVHQDNAGQLAAALRACGRRVAARASLLHPLAVAHAALAEWVSPRAGLILVREMAGALLTRHDALAAGSDPVARAASRCAERLALGRGILTAHLELLSGDEALARELPHPLSAYFASSEQRTCLRCHLDRPGSPAVHRQRPYQHACGACRDEVTASLPPDLREQWSAWPEPAQEAAILERAGSHPAKSEALRIALPPLFGREPRERVRLSERHPPAPSFPRKEPSGAHATERQLGPPRSDAEREYLAVLFSPESLRRCW